MLNVAGQTFTQHEKEIDESNQIIKSYEKYIGDDKVKNEVINNISENNMKEDTKFRKYGDIFKNINHKITKLLNKIKRQMQSET